MPSISRSKFGHIYDEEFDSNGAMWQFFPDNNQSYEIKEDKIILKHNRYADRVMALTKLPQEDFVMQCRIRHRPLTTDSFAGVLLLKSSTDWVECQTYRDIDASVHKFYRYIKVVKEGNTFFVYAATTLGEWEVVGAVTYENCNLIGFFFETDNENEQFDIEEINLYTAPNVSITGLNPSYSRVEIQASNGVPIASSRVDDGKCIFDLSKRVLPFRNCKVALIGPNGTVESDLLERIDGGDMFTVSHNVRITIDGEEIGTEDIVDLGRIGNGLETMITVENMDDEFTLFDQTVRVHRFSPYDSGYENVGLKIQDSEDEFQDEITIPHLRYGEPVNVVMKINRGEEDLTSLFRNNGHRYKIVVD